MTLRGYVCNICEGTSASELYSDSSVRYVLCDTCTLVSLYPRPTQEEYREFYKNEYQRHRHAVVDYEAAIERLERRDSLKRKRKILSDIGEYIPQGARVLEIGSGWGTVLKILKDVYDADVTGIEVSQLAARVSKDYYGVPTINQTFEMYIEHHVDKGLFDVIILSHVLEHFTDPAWVMKEMSALLKDTGYIFIAVPNVMKPDEPLDRFFHFEHCYYFSPLTLEKLLGNAECKIIRIENGYEIKMIAARNNNPSLALDTRHFEYEYAGTKVSDVIEQQRKKYATLRFLKNKVQRILPPRVFALIRNVGVKVLRKLRIIGT